MSTKFPSPLLGYNNNVRHKGRVFHIQTEDSGPKYGHIITHLFMDGGRILKSVKTSYSEYIGSEQMSEIVRETMKRQHKAMFIALRDGKFDPLADGAAGSSPGASRAGSAQSEAALDEDPEQAPPTARQSSRGDIHLDVETIERAAVAAATAGPTAPILRGAVDLPPPPARLFREKAPPALSNSSPSPPPAKDGAERRYAPTRPASIFGQARPAQGKSIFGGDLISDKSLDEVILSYLAEDLDEKK